MLWEKIENINNWKRKIKWKILRKESSLLSIAHKLNITSCLRNWKIKELVLEPDKLRLLRYKLEPNWQKNKLPHFSRCLVNSKEKRERKDSRLWSI